MSANITPTLAEFYRLAALETDECVLWPFSKSHKGYGHLHFHGSTVRVHVLACEMRHGPRPDRHLAIHLPGVCHQRSCLNYRHLRWGTHADNEADKRIDGTDNRGGAHPRSKLSATQVAQIRRLSTDGESAVAIGLKFAVSNVHVGRILRGQAWRAA